MSKLERLLKLMASLLYTTRPLTAAQIFERVEGYDPTNHEASRRAFERDKNDLRDLNIPISVEPAPDTDPPVEGYRIRPGDYYLDLDLDPDEVRAIQLAAKMVRLEGESVDEAFWKLGGNSGPDDAGMPAIAVVNTDPEVGRVFEAIRDRSVLRFDYNDEPREIDPWRLAWQRGHWYLVGFDRSRDAERNFRFDRISGGIELDEAGSASASPAQVAGERKPWEFDDTDEVLARVRFDSSAAAWASSQMGPDAKTAYLDDGSVEIEFRVTNVEAFRSFVLGFGERAEVVAPPSLRTDMITWLEALVAR